MLVPADITTGYENTNFNILSFYHISARNFPARNACSKTIYPPPPPLSEQDLLLPLMCIITSHIFRVYVKSIHGMRVITYLAEGV